MRMLKGTGENIITNKARRSLIHKHIMTPSEGVSTRLCSISNVSFNPHNAPFMPKLAPNPKGSPTSNPILWVKGKNESA